MKRIIGIGIVLVLAGCGLAVSVEQNSDLTPEGWYSPDKTAQQLSQDLDQCTTKCLTA